MFKLDELEDIVELECKKQNVDYVLAHAICSVESSWNTYAVRYEPNVEKYVHDTLIHAQNLNITELTEAMLQRFSYGLFQVMGFLARDLGHRGLLTELLFPEICAKYGVLYIKKQLNRYGNEIDAIAAYNAGSARKMDSGLYINQRYCDRVYSYINNLRRLT